MELGFQFNVDCCNTPIVIGFICVMIMVVVLGACSKGILATMVSKNKKKQEKKTEDIKLIEQKRDGE
jgi:hypothetical protein